MFFDKPHNETQRLFLNFFCKTMLPLSGGERPKKQKMRCSGFAHKVGGMPIIPVLYAAPVFINSRTGAFSDFMCKARCSNFSTTLNALQNYGIMDLQDHGYNDMCFHYSHGFAESLKLCFRFLASKLCFS